MFAEGQAHKTYWALVEKGKGEMDSEQFSLLTHWLVRNEKQNKSYAYDHEVPRSKKAMLQYRLLKRGEHYNLVEVQLLTGRHHQIRCQLAAIGSPIKGDLKYGAKRSNPDGGISLQAHRIEFDHPVSHQHIDIEVSSFNEAVALGHN
jgi:23S rRNA pseudouridine1911/1915/1917 synthase